MTPQWRVSDARVRFVRDVARYAYAAAGPALAREVVLRPRDGGRQDGLSRKQQQCPRENANCST